MRRRRQGAARPSLSDSAEGYEQLLVLDQLERDQLPAEHIEVEGRRLAEWLLKRLQESPVQLLPWNSGSLDPESAEGRHFSNSERQLDALGYAPLGDFEQTNITAIHGSPIRIRLLLAADQRSFATVWHWQAAEAPVDVTELSSWLADGCILHTHNLERSFEPAPMIKQEVFATGARPAWMHAAHQQRIDERAGDLRYLRDLADISALLERQRELNLSHRLAVRGITDHELRNWLGVLSQRMQTAVRQHLDRLLDAR